MRLSLSLAPVDSFAQDFTAIGEISLDASCVVATQPNFDEKIVASRALQFLSGGQAATAAVGVSRLGWRSAWIGATGNDWQGEELRRALGREGVRCGDAVVRECQTRSAIVLVEERAGRRVVIESRDAALNLTATDVTDDALGAGRITLVDGSDIVLSIRAARAARRRGSRTIVDLDRVDAGAMELLQEIDIPILPAHLIAPLTGAKDVGHGLAMLATDLPNATAIVATLGDEGAVAHCQGRELPVQPHVVDVIDTTGAGDAFRAGFAAAWLKSGTDPPDLAYLLDTAVIVGSLNCLGFGAQSALPRWNDVEAARQSRVGRV